MPNDLASALLRERARAFCNDQAPGCVFYITRNGKPFADGSFGWARMPGAPDGQLEMSATTLVHTGSVGKFICAVAIQRLIQEWNQLFDLPVVRRPDGGRALAPGVGLPADDARFLSTVWRHNARIGLGTKMYPILEPFLDDGLIADYLQRDSTRPYPGKKVRDITLKDLLGHTSGMAKRYDVADLGGPRERIDPDEPGDEGPAVTGLSKVVTALLRKPADPGSPWDYNNSAYAVLGAFIQAVTGRLYATWTRERLFPTARFADIDRKTDDHQARGARYYWKEPGTTTFVHGNRHPDYTRFGAAGGWYMSATQFCDWVDAVMQKEPINGRPILDDPQTLFDEFLGFDWACNVGRLRGASKNGAATPAGLGTTNARFAFLRGLGDERFCAFTEVNGGVDAEPLLNEGLLAIRPCLDSRPGPVPAPTGTMTTDGLLQAVYWDDAGILRSAAQLASVQLKNITIEGETRSRTDLFGSGLLAGSRSRNDIGMAELRGMLNIVTGGMYRFRLSSDDGSVLWLDEDLIVDNDGTHALLSKESQDVPLEGGGRYPIRVQWYNALGGGSLYLEWRTPNGTSYEPVPAAHFTPV